MEARLEKILRQLGLPPDALSPLAGDASARRFFRVGRPESGAGAVLVVFPEETARQDSLLYTGTAHLLREAGLPVPGIYRRLAGALLVEDCGDLLLQNAIRGRSPLDLYRRAVDLILEMQERVPPAAALNPPFNEEKFSWELEFFLAHTVVGWFGEKINPAQRKIWRRLFSFLAREPVSQPQAFCHRDFHSRNLLIQGEELRIIDFQDGRRGPVTYDLVSLLEDPYVSLPPPDREELKTYFQVEGTRRGAIFSGDFPRGYDIMAIQRLLKAAGTFGFQAVRKGNNRYAAGIPAALKRVGELMAAYPEFQNIREKLPRI